MIQKNGDLPAFAVVNDNGYVQFGLTKREYFALHLMQALISNADRHSQQGDCYQWNYQHLSEISIHAADALLAESTKIM